MLYSTVQTQTLYGGGSWISMECAIKPICRLSERGCRKINCSTAHVCHLGGLGACPTSRFFFLIFCALSFNLKDLTSSDWHQLVHMWVTITYTSAYEFMLARGLQCYSWWGSKASESLSGGETLRFAIGRMSTLLYACGRKEYRAGWNGECERYIAESTRKNRGTYNIYPTFFLWRKWNVQ